MEGKRRGGKADPFSLHLGGKEKEESPFSANAYREELNMP